ncbi:hypothetical protein C8J57DRAFT_1221144 [Mycena rebaudengoi]|nr:hypothetical protein C8J57DRAFT_1221144 [Mycena rebaudengoi]
MAETGFAVLYLCDGDPVTANTLFTKCFWLFQDIRLDGRFFYLQCLADLANYMVSIEITLDLAGIFLALAMKAKTKLEIMQAFRCFGKILPLGLFVVALDGFTFMDVHQWRADCTTRDVGQIDTKLAATEAVLLEKHNEQLLCLTEHNLPIGDLGAAHIDEDSEAEEYIEDIVDANQEKQSVYVGIVD